MTRWTHLSAPRFVVPALFGALGISLLAGAQTQTQRPFENADTARAVAHYERVERELLRADVTGLSPAQRAARSRAIEELRTYREARDFTRNTAHPGARVPVFVDEDGRRCAVAHLLHRFGRDDLVEHVAQTDNDAYVSDLSTSEPFQGWLTSVGLSLPEAARIQVPGTTWIFPDEEVEDGETIGGEESADDEPVVIVKDPMINQRSSVPSSLSTGPRGRRGKTAAGAHDWWRWWEMNKLDWMRPNQLRLRQGKLTGETYPVARIDENERALVVRREQVLPLLLEQLEHEDPRIRAAACISVARIGGALAVAPLLERVEDAQPSVRNRALIALGVTGSDRAAGYLLHVARTGKLPRKKKKVSDDARPVAVIGLALARRYGLELPVDGEVAGLLDDLKRRDELDVGTATLLYGLLSPSTRIDHAAERFATKSNTALAVQARAMEQLSGIAGEKSLKPLQRNLAGRKVELRRSAAVALASVESDLVLPRLLTAFELEKEALTRGFLLVSIAERGGAQAVPFLREQLEDGPQNLRAWAALGLGMVASEHDVEEARESLRRAKLPRRDEGALWLARGMARDHKALPRLRRALIRSDNPRNRAYAATALGLLGGDHARYALLARARTEKVSVVRVVIAQSLGLIGHTADADFIGKCLHETPDPALQGLLAVAVGFHGTQAVLDDTVLALRDPALPESTRAMAIEAVGVLLDREPGLALPKLSRRTNYAVMPNWLQDILSIPL